MSENIDLENIPKWFVYLNPFLDKEVSLSQKDFITHSAVLYTLLELEGIKESEAEDLMQDGFKMQEIREKWNVDELIEYSNAVSILVSSRIIQEFVRKINALDDVSDEDKQKMLDSIKYINTLDVW